MGGGPVAENFLAYVGIHSLAFLPSGLSRAVAAAAPVGAVTW